MKADHFRYLLSLIVILPLSWMISCSGRNTVLPVKNDTRSEAATLTASANLIKMISPEENKGFKLKENIKVELAPEQSATFDSIKVIFDGKSIAVLKSAPWVCSIGSSLNCFTGRKSVKAVAYSKEKTQSVTRFVIIYSDIVPRRFGYKVINVYPHDGEAFTQGLLYYNGILYEGTGQEAGSSLREVELKTGRVLRQHNLESSLFGEGIALYNDRIFEVTWRNKVGFVYNRSDFKVLNKIYYQTEGWGLTTINDRIIMSDGTNIIYFREPESFGIVSQLEVYDNEKKVDQLNELEYINGEIWANIWQTDLIARIDPLTGKVNSYIDLSQLFPEAKRRESNADVLNGIAWDKEGGRIFVTGKRWPKLYEIKITE